MTNFEFYDRGHVRPPPSPCFCVVTATEPVNQVKRGDVFRGYSTNVPAKDLIFVLDGAVFRVAQVERDGEDVYRVNAHPTE